MKLFYYPFKFTATLCFALGVIAFTSGLGLLFVGGVFLKNKSQVKIDKDRQYMIDVLEEAIQKLKNYKTQQEVSNG